MTDPSSFDRAYVALSYVLGRRGDELLSSLSAPSDVARRLVFRLAEGDRGSRATVLAAELARVVTALEDAGSAS